MITQATQKDVKALFSLENELFDVNNFPMSLGSLYYHIKRNTFFVYIHENKIVGYILWLKRKTYFRLYSLGVTKHFRGQGVAESLLDYSFLYLDSPSYTLEVKTTNTHAIKLYEKHGFKTEKLLRAYYPEGVDGYFMRKQDDDEA